MGKEDNESVEEAVMKYVGSISDDKKDKELDDMEVTLAAVEAAGRKKHRSKKKRSRDEGKREKHSKKSKYKAQEEVDEAAGFMVDPELTSLEDPSVMMDEAKNNEASGNGHHQDTGKTSDYENFSDGSEGKGNQEERLKELQKYVDEHNRNREAESESAHNEDDQSDEKLAYDSQEQELNIHLHDPSRHYDTPVTKSLEKKSYQDVLPKVTNSKGSDDEEYEGKTELHDGEFDKNKTDEIQEMLKAAVKNAAKSVDREVIESVKAASKMGRSANTIGGGSSSTSKAFTKEEDAALETFVTEYQSIEGLTRRQVCERIWSSERPKDNFWNSIYQILPYRTSSSIYKHMRRKYHIFEQRGKWTKEEDDLLARICQEKEGQWAEVGKALGRMPEDCRDRWRNYVKCGGNRSANRWSAEEEELLKRVIHEMIEEANRQYEPMMDDNSQIPDLENNENSEKNTSQSGSEGLLPRMKQGSVSFKDAINWTQVSERMNGARSRIQCRYKWNKLIRREALEKIDMRDPQEFRWVFERLKILGYNDESMVDWEDISMSNPIANLSPLEVEVCYEKMKKMAKQSKNKNPSEVSVKVLTQLGYHPMDEDDVDVEVEVEA
ncbi:DNA-binding protein REB1 [Nakaseomyces bracarensis]|uniref:DNA-binding protein REB1 n=1 Tax=Nakaseomyces bracarensis TaxID=273131 RepID=A0ABR4NMI5_9SACH